MGVCMCEHGYMASVSPRMYTWDVPQIRHDPDGGKKHLLKINTLITLALSLGDRITAGRLKLIAVYTCVSLECPLDHLCLNVITALITSFRRSKVPAHIYAKNGTKHVRQSCISSFWVLVCCHNNRQSPRLALLMSFPVTSLSYKTYTIKCVIMTTILKSNKYVNKSTTGVSSIGRSHLVPSVPGISSRLIAPLRSIRIFTEEKCL